MGFSRDACVLQVRSLKETLRAVHMQMERERAETRTHLRVRTDRMKALKGELVATVQVGWGRGCNMSTSVKRVFSRKVGVGAARSTSGNLAFSRKFGVGVTGETKTASGGSVLRL